MTFTLIPPTGHKINVKDWFGRAETDVFPPPVFWLNSGTSALYFLLASLDIEPHSSVIIPAYSCPAVAAAVLRAGHRPVLVDIESDTLQYNPLKLAEKIDAVSAAAVVWVNLFGISSPIPNLDIPVIVDNAQSDNFLSGEACGDGVVYSFGRGKPVNSLGGGVAMIRSPEKFPAAESFYQKLPVPGRVQSLKYSATVLAYQFLFNPRWYRLPTLLPGLHVGETLFEPNFRIELPVRKNLIIIQNILARFEKIRNIRSRICSQYQKIFEKHSDIIQTFNSAVFYRYPIIIRETKLRTQLTERLQALGISASGLYPVPLNRQQGLDKILKDNSHYKGGEFICEHLLTLPVNEFVTDAVLNAIKNTFSELINLRNHELIR